MQTVIFRNVLTAVDADVLSASELENAPGNGVYIIRAASTVATATLAVAGVRGAKVSSARLLTLRANGEVRAEDMPWLVLVQAGERVLVEIAGTTGTIHIEVTYIGG